MTAEELFRLAHSWTRWLLVLTIAVSLVYFAYGWLQGKAWTKRTQTLLSIFSSLVGLQWLLGLGLLITYGSVTGFGVRHFWEHLEMQTIAVAVAHMHMSWRKKEFSDRARYQRGFLLIAGVLLLLVVGIMVLPAAIQWRFQGL